MIFGLLFNLPVTGGWDYKIEMPTDEGRMDLSGRQHINQNPQVRFLKKAILAELKVARGGESLDNAAKRGMRQIEQGRYFDRFEREIEVMEFSIAFSGKNVEVYSRSRKREAIVHNWSPSSEEKRAEKETMTTVGKKTTNAVARGSNSYLRPTQSSIAKQTPRP